jgi:hypothetical protein
MWVNTSFKQISLTIVESRKVFFNLLASTTLLRYWTRTQWISKIQTKNEFSNSFSKMSDTQAERVVPIKQLLDKAYTLLFLEDTHTLESVHTTTVMSVYSEGCGICWKRTEIINYPVVIPDYSDLFWKLTWWVLFVVLQLHQQRQCLFL